MDRDKNLTSYPDDELVLRAQERDDAAFGELVLRTSRSSLRLAMSILRDRQEAEDEVQNSYLSAWRHVGQFQRESRFSTWMSRIVANHCLMRLRKARGAKFVYLDAVGADEGERPLEVADRSATPEGSLVGKEMSVLLRREIGKLPPMLRRALILRDVDELPTAEIATLLGISVPAVKSRIFRARAELRNRMENCCGGSQLAGLTA